MFNNKYIRNLKISHIRNKEKIETIKAEIMVKWTRKVKWLQTVCVTLRSCCSSWATLEPVDVRRGRGRRGTDYDIMSNRSTDTSQVLRLAATEPAWNTIHQNAARLLTLMRSESRLWLRIDRRSGPMEVMDASRTGSDRDGGISRRASNLTPALCQCLQTLGRCRSDRGTQWTRHWRRRPVGGSASMSHYAEVYGRFSEFDTAPAFNGANWSANVSFLLHLLASVRSPIRLLRWADACCGKEKYCSRTKKTLKN